MPIHENKDSLNILEKALKYVYENKILFSEITISLDNYPVLREILADNQKEKECFFRIFRYFHYNDSVKSHIFFNDKQDITITRNLRYFPNLPHAHDFFEMQYVIKGTLSQSINNKQITLDEGDICIISPGAVHTPFTDNKDIIMYNILIKKDSFQNKFINIIKANDIIGDFFTRFFYSNSYYPYIYCHIENSSQIKHIVFELYDIWLGSMQYKNRLLNNKLEELLLYLLEQHEHDLITGIALNDSAKNIIPILKYIQDNFKEVTLSKAAEHFGYNESYLSRLIKKYTDQAFSDIVQTTRLHHAVTLLETSTFSIDTICTETGYNNKSYFYKVFSKKYNMTPANYRQKYQQNNHEN